MIHIAVKGTNSFCGRRVMVAITLRFILRNYGFATGFLSQFVCRECGEALGKSIRSARAIR